MFLVILQRIPVLCRDNPPRDCHNITDGTASQFLTIYS